MTRLVALAAALTLAAPAAAGTYSATPQNPAKVGTVVTRDLAWTQKNGVFVGRTDQSRPIVLCQALAKKVGPLSRFAVDGRPLTGAELAKCNGLRGGGEVIANAN